MVLLSVCLSVTTVCRAQSAEPIDMPFALWILREPRIRRGDRRSKFAQVKENFWVSGPALEALLRVVSRKYSLPPLVPVLGSQPAGDVSHKLGGRLPLLFARPAVTLKLARTRLPSVYRVLELISVLGSQT